MIRALALPFLPSCAFASLKELLNACALIIITFNPLSEAKASIS